MIYTSAWTLWCRVQDHKSIIILSHFTIPLFIDIQILLHWYMHKKKNYDTWSRKKKNQLWSYHLSLHLFHVYGLRHSFCHESYDIFNNIQSLSKNHHWLQFSQIYKNFLSNLIKTVKFMWISHKDRDRMLYI